MACTPGHSGKIVEGHATLVGEGIAAAALGEALGVPPADGQSPDVEEPMEGQKVLLAVPQEIGEGQFALVVIGEAQVLHGVKLVGNGVKLGED